jgi:hypothetical protein
MQEQRRALTEERTMGRRSVPQKRMGKKEAGQFGALLKAVKNFKIFPKQKKLGETKFNAFLINYLLQREIGVENVNIIPAKFVGEVFRPECLLRGSGHYGLCAIECKKLNDQYAKARWKEGLSQALLYAQYYKAVIYVLFDYSSGAEYASAFGRGNRVESRFANELRRVTRSISWCLSRSATRRFSK